MDFPTLLLTNPTRAQEANTPCNNVFQACQKINREIYLTFDDGVQAGTEEVLNALADSNVRATFFLTGVHMFYFHERHPDKFKKIMSRIYNDHEIGNHSWSHANDHYSAYYRSGGVKVGNNNERRSVVDDFEKNKDQIMRGIDIAQGRTPSTSYEAPFPLAKNQKKPCARFPGTNTWYVDDALKDIACSDRGDFWSFCKEDTKEEAEALYKTGYKIYGWDCEWNMSFDFHKLALKDESDRIENKTMDYSNERVTHPDYNMYNEKFNQFDRPTESWQKVRDELLDMVYYAGLWDDSGKRKGKAILLMHERAFRSGKNEAATYIAGLKSLIDYFKGINAQFKTLDEY